MLSKFPQNRQAYDDTRDAIVKLVETIFTLNFRIIIGIFIHINKLLNIAFLPFKIS